MSPSGAGRPTEAPGSLPALVVDGGRSGVRARWLDRDGSVDLPELSGLPVIAGPQGPAAVQARLDEALDLCGRQLDTEPAPSTIVAGLTGLGEAREAADRLADRLAEQHPASRIILCSDVITSYLGAMGPRPGVVAAFGTGAVTLALNGAGDLARVDGWGPVIGDAGSGFDLGRQGLRLALATYDGRHEAQALLEAAKARYGDPATVTARIYEAANPAALVAAFAQDLLSLAAVGDPHALELKQHAVAAVVAAVQAAAEQACLSTEDRRWSYTGSLLREDGLLREPASEALAEAVPPFRAKQPRGDALQGAVELLESGTRHLFAAALIERA